MLNPFDPTPHINRILGMPIYEAVKESQILAHLDDFEAPQCQHNQHNLDSVHHSGAAGFLVSAPCSHGNEYVCSRFVEWALTQTGLPYARCNYCGLTWEVSKLTLIPIGGAL